MILDASIVVALVFREASMKWISETLAAHPRENLRMSWVNLAEASMTIAREKPAAATALEVALADLGVEMLETDHDVIRAATEARRRFPINFGDCFAYAHARLRSEPLLTLDADFLKTDLPEILHPKRRT